MPSESEGYKGISLKASIVNDIEAFINSSNSHYRSVAEFVSEAIRLRLEQLKNCERE